MFTWVWIVPLAAASLIAAPIDPSVVHICAIEIQDRANTGISTAVHDERLQRELEKSGFKVEMLSFKPLGDAEHESRKRGCGYLMYTDVSRAEKLGGASKLFRRPAGGSIYEAEVEFRIFKLDAELPFVSAAVTARNRNKKLQPKVESRVVDYKVPTGDSIVDTAERLSMTQPLVSTPMQVQSKKSVAIENAVERQARAIENAFRHPSERGAL